MGPNAHLAQRLDARARAVACEVVQEPRQIAHLVVGCKRVYGVPAARLHMDFEVKRREPVEHLHDRVDDGAVGFELERVVAVVERPRGSDVRLCLWASLEELNGPAMELLSEHLRCLGHGQAHLIAYLHVIGLLNEEAVLGGQLLPHCVRWLAQDHLLVYDRARLFVHDAVLEGCGQLERRRPVGRMGMHGGEDGRHVTERAVHIDAHGLVAKGVVLEDSELADRVAHHALVLLARNLDRVRAAHVHLRALFERESPLSVRGAAELQTPRTRLGEDGEVDARHRQAREGRLGVLERIAQQEVHTPRRGPDRHLDL